jgi:hypothetical protein
MANSASDDIYDALMQIDARVAASDLKPAEKQQLLEAKATLGLQLAEIARNELVVAAKAVGAAATRLAAVIASANDSNFTDYWARLQEAVQGIGVSTTQQSEGGDSASVSGAGSSPEAAPSLKSGTKFSGATNAYGLPLSQAVLDNACQQLGVTSAEIWAIIFTETDAPYGGFFSDGWPQILYEQHIFHRLTDGKFDKSNPDISSVKSGNYGAGGHHQYDRLKQAIALDEDAGLQSASWGIGQTLGTNYKALGYKTPRQMVLDMFLSEDLQLNALVKEIITSDIAKTLASHDWKNFARVYNGPNYSTNNYDEHLRSWYAKFAAGALPDLRVRSAQMCMMLLGFHPSDLDGLWGPRTQSSLNQYQKARGLKETIMVDDNSLSKLADEIKQLSARAPASQLFS